MVDFIIKINFMNYFFELLLIKTDNNFFIRRAIVELISILNSADYCLYIQDSHDRPLNCQNKENMSPIYVRIMEILDYKYVYFPYDNLFLGEGIDTYNLQPINMQYISFCYNRFYLLIQNISRMRKVKLFKKRQHQRPRRVPHNRHQIENQGFRVLERISENPKHGRSISRAQHENNNNSMVARLYGWKDESIKWYEQYFVNLANYYQNQNTFQKNYCSYLPEFYKMFKTANNFYFFIEFIDGGTLEDKINQNKASSVYMEQAQALKYIKQLVKFMKLVKKEKLALDCIQAKDIFIPFPLQLKVITQPIYQDRYFYRPILKKNRPDDEEHSQYRAPEKYQAFVRGKPATQFDQNREAKIDQLMEQQNRQINEKAQIWSIGIILYQMLFNCTPFQGLQLYKAMNEQYILCRNGKNLADFNFNLL